MKRVEFKLEPVGWKGQRIRFAVCNGEAREFYTGDPFDQKDRSRCIRNILTDAPGLDEEVLQASMNTWAADRAADEAKEGADDATTKADVAVQLALGFGDFFHDVDGDAFVDVRDGGRRRTLRVESMTFRRWLDAEYYRVTRSALGASPRADAISTLAAIAQHEGPEHEVHVRTANMGDRVFIDLCDDEGRTVVVNGEGWDVLEAPNSIRFWRPRGMRPMPVPVAGGEVEELRAFLAVDEDEEATERSFVLTVAWLVAALWGRGPYPIAVLQGEQGSGKSTRSRLLRELVDPNAAPLRSQPRGERDLVIAAKNSALLSYDNLSHVPPWLSDGLCRLATGGGFATRQLYTDAEEVLFQSSRPTLLNGIPDLVSRPDLASRAIVFRLPPLGNVEPENQYWARFGEAHPRILGALLDGLVAALANRDRQVDDPPRMADFANLVHRAEPAFGWEDGAFVGHYREAIAALVRDELAVEPVAVAIAELLVTPFETTQKHSGFSLVDGALSARASDWLAALEAIAETDGRRRSTGWPNGPRALSNKVARLAPALRQVGIHVDRGRTGEARCITAWREAE